jgi:hypothetical protein
MTMIRDKYRVVDFGQIDDTRCLRPLEDAVQDEPLAQERLDLIRAQLGQAFRQEGWNGQGEITCIFIPPCFCYQESQECVTVFHVSHGEQSWLAIPEGVELSMPLRTDGCEGKVYDAKISPIEAMRQWFFQRYKNPDEAMLPYVDGQYLFLYGGPYNAREVLIQEFSGYYSAEEIEALVENLEECFSDYSPAQPDPGCWPSVFDEPSDTIEPDPQDYNAVDRGFYSGEVPRDSIPF